MYNGPLDESGGRWFTGLGQGFIEFPKQLLTMTLSSDFSGTQGPTMLCTAEVRHRGGAVVVFGLGLSWRGGGGRRRGAGARAVAVFVPGGHPK